MEQAQGSVAFPTVPKHHPRCAPQRKLQRLTSPLAVADLRTVGSIANLPTGGYPPRIVGGRWTEVVARILKRDPLCKHCLAQVPSFVTPSQECDHIVPVHLLGGHEDSNLQGLCWECHNRKTVAELRARLAGTAQYAPSRREVPTEEASASLVFA